MAFFYDDQKIIEKNEDAEIAYLMTADDSFEGEILCGILRDAGIPCMAKDRFSGGTVRVLTGMSNLGTDIYVVRPRLEEARALAEAFTSEAVDAGQDSADGGDAGKKNSDDGTDE